MKVHAVMSVPRLGFTAGWRSIHQSLNPLGIPMTAFEGAFWHQTIQRAFTQVVNAGYEWILAIDYDSVFTRDDLQKLLAHANSRPDLDAIAPLQVKRWSNLPLHEPPEILDGLFPVESANFGLTLIRTSALQKVKKPWFLCVPDEFGEYILGTDADMYFWEKWKESGCSLAVAGDVRIGHLELCSAIFDESGEAVRQVV